MPLRKAPFDTKCQTVTLVYDPRNDILRRIKTRERRWLFVNNFDIHPFAPPPHLEPQFVEQLLLRGWLASPSSTGWPKTLP